MNNKNNMNTINIKYLGINEVKVCKTSFSQSLGLMFSRKNNARALLFEFEKEKKVPLHMFFVFYPIDVLYLNEDNEGNKRVVELKEDFKPFTFYFPKNKAKYVVELPANSVNKGQLDVNDTLVI